MLHLLQSVLGSLVGRHLALKNHCFDVFVYPGEFLNQFPFYLMVVGGLRGPGRVHFLLFNGIIFTESRSCSIEKRSKELGREYFKSHACCNSSQSEMFTFSSDFSYLL